MRQNVRSSFFYFLFCTICGTFPAFLFTLYLSHISKPLKSTKILFTMAGFSLLILSMVIYWQAATKLMAPFTLREMLNSKGMTVSSSTLGFLWALLALLFHRKVLKIDYFKTIQEEAPVIPALICWGVGSVCNILAVASIYWYLNEF